MPNVYRVVMRGCGTTAVAATTCYTFATSMAVSDGAGIGVEIPPPVNTLSILLIICTTIIGGGAWIVQRSHREAAEQHIRPVIRAEMERAVVDTMPLLVATVAEAVAARVVPQMHEVAVSAGRQTAARLHEVITLDIREILTDAHRKAIVTGQTMQLNATGEAIGRAALRSIPQYVRTSTDD